MNEQILKDLKRATRWDDISQGEDSLIVRFNLKEIGKIHGLRARGQKRWGYELDFRDFDEVPISFLITKDGTTQTKLFQYWTLGGRMHREGGPAFVCLGKHTYGFKFVERRWFWHDIVHNTNGPAVETGRLKSSENEELSYDGYSLHRYSNLKQEWFINGKSRKPEDGPKSLHSPDIDYWINDKTGKIESPSEIRPAIEALQVLVEWNTVENCLYPFWVQMNDLTELRWKQSTSRTCSHIDISWNYRWMKYNNDACHSWFYDNMIQQVNLWDGPFFTTPMDEYISITEMDKLANAN